MGERVLTKRESKKIEELVRERRERKVDGEPS